MHKDNQQLHKSKLSDETACILFILNFYLLKLIRILVLGPAAKTV